MKEEKTLEEQLKNLRISKDDPKALRKKIEELEAKLQQSEQRPNIISGNEEEIYNRLVNVYENTQTLNDYINDQIKNGDGNLFYIASAKKAVNEYKGKLEKELLSMDNINEEVMQRISNYIDKKQIFNNFSPTDSAKAGVFLTKLIEISPLTEIILKLENGSNIDCFGYSFAEKKKIIVYGDLGRVGYDMKTGELEINGNVKNCCGYDMEGGKIVVHGDVNEYCGSCMKGGSIEIYGNANDCVALDMEGGRIHIKGYVIGNCGGSMKGGELEIDGNVDGDVGNFMERGRMHIRGNVYGNVAKFMGGGTIHINGDKKPELYTEKEWFVDKITKTGGSVYHKGRLLE